MIFTVKHSRSQEFNLILCIELRKLINKRVCVHFLNNEGSPFKLHPKMYLVFFTEKRATVTFAAFKMFPLSTMPGTSHNSLILKVDSFTV